jgi:hypothetical protein
MLFNHTSIFLKLRRVYEYESCFQVLYDSVSNYTKYQTGNSIQQTSMENLPFPAVSICCSYFDWGKAYKVGPSLKKQTFFTIISCKYAV